MRMARKSKIETSPHYNEIVELLVAGYSGRYVSDYLENEYTLKQYFYLKSLSRV